MAIAVVALLAIGAGGATAARMIGSKDIKKRAIAHRHLKPGAVTPPKVRPRAIRRRHLAPSAQRPGPPGPPGTSEVHYPFRVSELDPGEESDGREGAPCPPDTYPTGGSAAAYDDDDRLVPGVVKGSQAGFIDDDGIPHGWSGEWANDTEQPVTVVIEAICVPADVVSGPPLGDPTQPPEPDRSRRPRDR